MQMEKQTTAADLRPGFANPVLDGQAVFRGVLKALSYPGRIQPLPVSLDPPAPLNPCAAAVLLALSDLDAPVWLDPALDTPAVRAWLRFHAGCTIVEGRWQAAFAVIPANGEIDGFRLGTPEYPETSTTVIVQVERLSDDAGPTLTGPGIANAARVAAPALPQGFWQALRSNHALFPEGIDVILAAPGHLAGLPRTTLVTE